MAVAFEWRFGGLATHHGSANAVAQEACDKIVAALDAYGAKLTNPAAKVDALYKAMGSKEKKYSGVVGTEVSKIKAVFGSAGSIGAKLNHIEQFFGSAIYPMVIKNENTAVSYTHLTLPTIA